MHGLEMGGRDYRQWFGGYANDKALSNVPMIYLQDIISARHEEEEEDPENVGNTLQIQAGHSKKTALTHYGRSVRSFGPAGTRNLDPRSMQRFIAASDEWLRDVGLESNCRGEGIRQTSSRALLPTAVQSSYFGDVTEDAQSNATSLIGHYANNVMSRSQPTELGTFQRRQGGVEENPDSQLPLLDSPAGKILHPQMTTEISAG